MSGGANGLSEEIESLVTPFAALSGPGVALTAFTADGSLAREFAPAEGLIVGLPARCRVSVTVSEGGGAEIIAYLDPAVPHLSPLEALRLVDQGFRIPYVDPGGAVEPRRSAVDERPPEDIGPDSKQEIADAVAVATDPASGEDRGRAFPSEAELWAARLVNAGGSDLLQPLVSRDGVYHLVQDQETVDKILSEELPQLRAR